MKRKLANINQEAKIGVSIILVALLFFGGVGLTKKWVLLLFIFYVFLQ